jgi:hypothetical protein
MPQKSKNTKDYTCVSYSEHNVNDSTITRAVFSLRRLKTCEGEKSKSPMNMHDQYSLTYVSLKPDHCQFEPLIQDKNS